LPTKSRI